MADLQDLFKRCRIDPQWESLHVSKRPLRGPQAEMIKRVEAFVTSHQGGVMTVLSSRQTGKNETAAVLQRRHLWRRQNSLRKSSWIRTAPTYVPQIVNSKKRLEELMQIDARGRIGHPLFLGQKIRKSEGYIWQVKNATVEFMSSGPTSNVVGATASECLDMDEAHKINRAKFDEDFAPFTASTNAATLLFGVAADGLDTIESYRNLNKENGRDDLNLYYPCELWAEALPSYRGHLEGRVSALGWDHPIIKTQYRLIPVAQEGTFINGKQARSLFAGGHDRHLSPRPNTRYQILIDVAAGNEDFNPDASFIGEEETATDSTVVWIYEVTSIICANNIYPVIRIVNLLWWTGVPLPQQEAELKELINYWSAEKVTIDGVGVGRQLGESLEQEFGKMELGGVVNMYVANSTSISLDCFDLLARLNFSAVLMFNNDSSPEWAEFERQVGWTKYASDKGKMALMKPTGGKKHIDMVKALTYINQNSPDSSIHTLLSVESQD